VQPQAFEAEYPELYRLLARYYRQDPARTGVLDDTGIKAGSTSGN
jgi:Mlc titration factor MtfA (ptsG expression regulator)